MLVGRVSRGKLPFPTAGLVPVGSLIASALLSTPSPYTEAPFPQAGERMFFLSHVRQCEGSRTLIRLECVLLRLVTMQVLSTGVR